MSFNVITISRDFGSGGRTVGNKLAEALGIPCYDSEIVDKIAENSEFSKEYLDKKTDENNIGFFSNIFKSNYYYESSEEDIIFAIQSKVIKQLAEKPCVIVGRCSDYILKDRNDVFNVFIYADDEARKKRIIKQYGENEKLPERRLRDKDKQRAAYYRYFTDKQWGDPRNYDICLNSAKLGINGCVEILLKAINDK